MKTLCLTLLTFLLFACTHDNVYVNRKSDIDERKVVMDNFYSNIANKNYAKIDNLIGDSLKHLSGNDGISKMIRFMNTKVGNYTRYILVDQYIRSIEGSKNETSYNYKLKVIYEKGPVEEIVGFTKQNGSEIKLNSYHANSDLLIH